MRASSSCRRVSSSSCASTPPCWARRLPLPISAPRRPAPRRPLSPQKCFLYVLLPVRAHGGAHALCLLLTHHGQSLAVRVLRAPCLPQGTAKSYWVARACTAGSDSRRVQPARCLDAKYKAAEWEEEFVLGGKSIRTPRAEQAHCQIVLGPHIDLPKSSVLPQTAGALRDVASGVVVGAAGKAEQRRLAPPPSDAVLGFVNAQFEGGLSFEHVESTLEQCAPAHHATRTCAATRRHARDRAGGGRVRCFRVSTCRGLGAGQAPRVYTTLF